MRRSNVFVSCPAPQMVVNTTGQTAARAIMDLSLWTIYIEKRKRQALFILISLYIYIRSRERERQGEWRSFECDVVALLKNAANRFTPARAEPQSQTWPKRYDTAVAF